MHHASVPLPHKTSNCPISRTPHDVVDTVASLPSDYVASIEHKNIEFISPLNKLDSSPHGIDRNSLDKITIFSHAVSFNKYSKFYQTSNLLNKSKWEEKTFEVGTNQLRIRLVLGPQRKYMELHNKLRSDWQEIQKGPNPQNLFATRVRNTLSNLECHQILRKFDDSTYRETYAKGWCGVLSLHILSKEKGPNRKCLDLRSTQDRAEMRLFLELLLNSSRGPHMMTKVERWIQHLENPNQPGDDTMGSDLWYDINDIQELTVPFKAAYWRDDTYRGPSHAGDTAFEGHNKWSVIASSNFGTAYTNHFNLTQLQRICHDQQDVHYSCSHFYPIRYPSTIDANSQLALISDQLYTTIAKSIQHSVEYEYEHLPPVTITEDAPPPTGTLSWMGGPEIKIACLLSQTTQRLSPRLLIEDLNKTQILKNSRYPPPAFFTTYMTLNQLFEERPSQIGHGSGLYLKEMATPGSIAGIYGGQVNNAVNAYSLSLKQNNPASANSLGRFNLDGTFDKGNPYTIFGKANEFIWDESRNTLLFNEMGVLTFINNMTNKNDNIHPGEVYISYGKDYPWDHVKIDLVYDLAKYLREAITELKAEVYKVALTEMAQHLTEWIAADLEIKRTYPENFLAHHIMRLIDGTEPSQYAQPPRPLHEQAVVVRYEEDGSVQAFNIWLLRLFHNLHFFRMCGFRYARHPWHPTTWADITSCRDPLPKSPTLKQRRTEISKMPFYTGSTNIHPVYKGTINHHPQEHQLVHQRRLADYVHPAFFAGKEVDTKPTEYKPAYIQTDTKNKMAENQGHSTCLNLPRDGTLTPNDPQQKTVTGAPLPRKPNSPQQTTATGKPNPTTPKTKCITRAKRLQPTRLMQKRQCRIYTKEGTATPSTELIRRIQTYTPPHIPQPRHPNWSRGIGYREREREKKKILVPTPEITTPKWPIMGWNLSNFLSDLPTRDKKEKKTQKIPPAPPSPGGKGRAVCAISCIPPATTDENSRLRTHHENGGRPTHHELSNQPH